MTPSEKILAEGIEAIMYLIASLARREKYPGLEQEARQAAQEFQRKVQT